MPDERWPFPVVVQVASTIIAAANMALIKVLFVDAFAIPLMVLVSAATVVVAGRPCSVTLSRAEGVVVIRAGFISRRIRLNRITSAEVKRTGITIRYFGGRQLSLCTNWLISWLRIPTPADRIARAVSRAVEDAREQAADDPEELVWIAMRSNPAMIALACVGLVAIAAAFLVRFSWPNPLLTVVAVMFAVYIGVTGLFLVMFAVWVLASERRAERP